MSPFTLILLGIFFDLLSYRSVSKQKEPVLHTGCVVTNTESTFLHRYPYEVEKLVIVPTLSPICIRHKLPRMVKKEFGVSRVELN